MSIQDCGGAVVLRGRETTRGVRDSAPTRGHLDPYEWEAIWIRCWRRIRTWRVPARWSSWDWRDEARAEGFLAICEADREYDLATGIPRQAFLYQRIVARVWTRYRQEWGYGRRVRSPLPIEQCPTRDECPIADDRDEIPRLMGQLTERDRWLIRRLFWDGKTEATVAADLGISQQAVNQHKTHALRICCGFLKRAAPSGDRFKIPAGPSRLPHGKITHRCLGSHGTAANAAPCATRVPRLNSSKSISELSLSHRPPR